ncbi:LysR family transcriptional regulator [Roseovarius nanhaiticus]|uniref:LysR family transcriptional regulator n=1 Tax=Roseovarius nanhaiticus TaxID=573024 RepID=UPI0031F08DB0
MGCLSMVKSLPPLAWFRAFESAARHLSFTAAASEIGMTQSAVSQHVRSLETSLGVMLFIRRARGLSLTDDGRKLLPKVGAALESLTAATRAYDPLPTDNVLTIASSVSVAQWIIAPHLSEFTQRHPEIRLRFLSTIWPDDFNTVRADVEIPFGSEKQVGRNAARLKCKGLVALKAPELPGTVDTLPLIEAVGTSDGWKTWGTLVGKHLKPEIFVDTYGAALNIAAHGTGVALVAEILAHNALQTGQLVMAHSAVAASTEAYYLRINEAKTTACDFRDWLLEKVDTEAVSTDAAGDRKP